MCYRKKNKKFISQYKIVIITLGVFFILFLLTICVIGYYIYYMNFKKEYVNLELIASDSGNLENGYIGVYRDTDEYLDSHQDENLSDKERVKETLLQSGVESEEYYLLVSYNGPIESIYYYNDESNHHAYIEYKENDEEGNKIFYYKIKPFKHKICFNPEFD